MNIITKFNIGRLKTSQIKDLLPAKFTSDGEVIGVIVDPQDVIVLGDLAPALRNKLRALENRARSVMPPDTKIKENV